MPSRRGGYWVCPNGRIAEAGHYEDNIQDSAFDITTQISGSKGNVGKIQFTSGEIVIGKTANTYDKETINELGKKMLSGRINVPTSYRLESFTSGTIDRYF